MEFDMLNEILTNHDLIASEAILEEYRAVLARDAFKGKRARYQALYDEIKQDAECITPGIKIDNPKDQDDAIYLEAAEAGKADLIVTGNLKHFPQSHKNIRIVDNRGFLDLL